MVLLPHLSTSSSSWTKTALMFSLLLSTSTASSVFRSPNGKLWAGIFFLSRVIAAASGSSVFVVPSTELWTGSRVEVGCYTDQDKQVGWSQIQIRRGWLSFYDAIDISLIVMHVSFLMDTASTETMTRLSAQIIWARQPLGGGEEELVAHQDTLLLAQDPRITVFVQQLGDRQVSKVTVRLPIALDFNLSLCRSQKPFQQIPGSIPASRWEEQTQRKREPK